MRFWREAVIVLLVGFLGYMWLESHDAKIRGAVYEDARKEIQQKEKQQLSEIEALRKQIRDPQVIVKEVPKYLPFEVEQNQPLVVASGAQETGAGRTKDGREEPPPNIVIQGQQLPKFWDYVQTCRECEVKLEARDAEVANLEKQLKQERKKSGFWGKAKWFAIGAGAGALYGMTR